MISVPETFSIALHALVLLAGKRGVYLSGKQIAETYRFSAHHVAKVLAQLVRAGLLESQRGPSGGVCFTLRPQDVTLGMVRHVVEGRVVARKGCLLPPDVCPGNRCVAGCFLSKMEREFRRVFQTTTLADVLRSAKKKGK